MNKKIKASKFYEVMCIDNHGTGSWEYVEYSHTDNKKHMHGFIERTGKMVEFLEGEEGCDDFLGVTYNKVQ